MRLTERQRAFLRLLAAEPEPSIFQWKSKVGRKIVDPIGGPDNWSHFRITTRIKNNLGYVTGRKVATVTAQEFAYLRDSGLTTSCAITNLGRAALAQSEGEK